MQTLIRTLLFVLLVWTIPVYGQQDFDAAMKDTLFEYPLITYKSSIIFKQFIEQHQYDSAHSILNYWERKCGMRGTILRAKVALAIATGKNADSILPANSLDLLDDYQIPISNTPTASSLDSDYHYYGSFFSSYNPGRKADYYGCIVIAQEFDSFTKAFFEKMLPLQQPYTTNYILSEFYGITTDSLFDRIQDKRHPADRLTLEYYERVKNIKNKIYNQWAISAGVWVPMGEAKLLGVHPEVGFQAGIKYGRINVSLAGDIRFLRAKTGYNATRVRSDHSVVYTHNFFGGYIGVNGGYDLLYRGNHEVQALLGIGIDGFNALPKDDVSNLKSETAMGYNVNFGAAYRYYIKNSLCMGLRVKYSVVNYALNGVVDFTGNTVSATIFIGGFEYGARERLESLKYKWR